MHVYAYEASASNTVVKEYPEGHTPAPATPLQGLQYCQPPPPIKRPPPQLVPVKTSPKAFFQTPDWQYHFQYPEILNHDDPLNE